MKLLLLALILHVNIFAQSDPSTSTIPRTPFLRAPDKQLHIGACYMVSSITTAYVYKRTCNERKAVLVGFVSGMLVGLAKELYDLNHGDPDLADLAADAIGSGLGTICISITF